MYYFLQSIKKIYLCSVVVKPIGKKKKEIYKVLERLKR